MNRCGLRPICKPAPASSTARESSRPTELAEGFPRSKNTLYEYEAIILGDIEKEFSTTTSCR